VGYFNLTLTLTLKCILHNYIKLIERINKELIRLHSFVALFNFVLLCTDRENSFKVTCRFDLGIIGQEKLYVIKCWIIL
jgi:hypothetical protein